jgi:uncharacterized protein (DUF342 family)
MRDANPAAHAFFIIQESGHKIEELAEQMNDLLFAADTHRAVGNDALAEEKERQANKIHQEILEIEFQAQKTAAELETVAQLN